MPKVPVQQLREVSSRPLSQNRLSSAGATPDAFGAAQARGLQQFGAGVFDVGETADRIVVGVQERDNSRMLLDADTAWQAAQREHLVGTAEKPGYYNLNGQNAVNAAAPVATTLADIRKEMAKNIANPAVRAAFEKKSLSDLNTHLAKINDHSVGARREADKASRTAAFNEAVQHAAGFAHDETAVADAIQLAQGIAEEQAMDDGLDEVATKSAVEAAQSAVLKSAVVSLSTTDAAKAGALYEKTKGMIDADVRLDIEKVLETSTIAEVSQAAAEIALDQFPGDPEGARAFIRANYSGKEEDAAIRELNSRYSEAYTDESRRQIMANRALAEVDRTVALERRQHEANVKAAYGDALSAVQQGTSLDTWLKENPEQAQFVLERDLSGLVRAEQAFARGETFAKVTNADTLNSFLQLSPDDRAGVDPETLRHDLTEKDYNNVVRLTNSAKTQVQHRDNWLYPAADKLLQKYAPKSAGFGKSKPTDTELATRQGLTDEVHTWVADQINSGKTPTMEQIEQKVRQSSIEIVKPDAWGADGGFFRGTVQQAVRRLPKDQWQYVRVSLPSIPEALLTKIKGAAAAYKQEPTDELIEQLAGAMAMASVDPEGSAMRINKLLDPDGKHKKAVQAGN